ncbi:sulfatase-like hydrolase/transferase [Nonlabens sp. Asnod3-A02]|uniref:sulfatase-like hydrolase/transferase n=1 Tax=Nonlabens sp. Asnod3-A02 TaxID=3160579 RepID=UPI0038662EE3
MKNKIVKAIVSFVFAAFVMLQSASVFLTGSIADYKFYEHLEWNVVSNIYEEFLFDALLLFIVLVVVLILLFLLSMSLQKVKKMVPAGIIALGMIFLSLNNHMVHNIYETYSLKKENAYSLNTALAKLDVPDINAIAKSDIDAIPGKNIIFLSLESFEKGFITERPDLTPNLNRLIKNGSFKTMNPTTGGGWTSASAYMTMTGMPAFFGSEGNDVFQGSRDFKLNTLGDVLQTAGYELTYLLANKDFSGIREMLETFHFRVKSEIDFETSYERIPWGLHDKDLFEEIKKEVLLKSNQDQPFALFASTVSTHFPDGLYDKRMESIIEPKNSNLEFMVASVDYYIGELIKVLKSENILEDTVVIMVPDHLFMAKHETVDRFKERSLFVLSTAGNSVKDRSTLNQISMPRTILSLAGIESNVKFLTDVLNNNKNDFIDNNKQALRDINIAALKTANFADGFNIIKSDSIISINQLKDNLSLEKFIVNDNESVILQVQLDHKLRISSKNRIPFQNLKESLKEPKTLHIIVEDADILKSFFTDVDGIVSYKKGDLITYSYDEVQSKLSSIDHLEEKELISTAADEAIITIKSASFNSKKRSWFKIKDNQTLLDRGINLITFDDKGKMTAHIFDTYSNPQSITELIKAIKTAKKDKYISFLIAHDTAGENFNNYGNDLDVLRLQKLKGLKNRQAYIAQIKNNSNIELVDDLLLEKQFKIPYSEVKPLKNSAALVKKYSVDNNRFIAHAGGKIDGKIYTNSLEALNLSYEKGFRLFELDIIKTSDGKFVAAHDWNIWKEQTGFTGETPVTLEEFQRYKVHNLYSTLDMVMINNWFKTHRDAILVTDKTRDISGFGNQFIDKNRLRMEVFTLPDAEKALNLGIEPMLSENIINNFKENILDFAKKNKVKYIVLSRASIMRNRELLSILKKEGIHSYVYHVNFQSGKDEKYVVDYELGTVYGMYADDWNLKEE